MRSQRRAAVADGKSGGGQDDEPEGELGAMEEISAEAALAIQETREISYNLRPFQLDRLGLTKSVEASCVRSPPHRGIRITSHVDNIDDAFSEDLRINFYRIVQESLNNIMKHAQATEAEVSIVRNEERMILSIHDNGNGFTPGNRSSKGEKSGFGLTGMAERANLLGGDFRVRSAPGQGTVMTVEIPLGGERRG